MKKHAALFEVHGIDSISFLYNNAHELDEFIIAGTRGWYHDDDCKNMPESADFEKLTKREALRLRTSLTLAKKMQESSGKEIIVFTHFPPYWNGKESESLMDVLSEFGIKRLYFGHIHGNYTLPSTIVHRGIEMSLVSADYLGFVPKIIKK